LLALPATIGYAMQSEGKRRRVKGDGSVHLRDDGLYQGRIDLGREDGKRKSKSVYARTEAECIQKMHAVRLARSKGVNVLAKRHKLSDYLETWLADVVTPSRRPGTVRSYEGIIRIHLIPGLGHIDLSKLDAPAVRKFLNAKLKEGSSARNVELMRAVLHACIHQAVRDDLVPRNVVSLTSAPTVKRPAREFLNVDHARAVIKTAADHKRGALFVTAIATGCRLGELLALEWSDVDLHGGFIRVSKQLQRQGGRVGHGGSRLATVEPKTERSNRTLPVPSFAIDSLRKHKEVRQALASKRGLPWSEDLHVFGCEGFGPTEPRNATRTFKAFLKEAEVPDVRFHDLRHACASLMLSQGTDLRTIMQHLGHSQIALTMNTYSHVVPQLQREAANRLEFLAVAG
jgi:integrase